MLMESIRLQIKVVLVWPCTRASFTFSALTFQAHGEREKVLNNSSHHVLQSALYALSTANGINYDFPLCAETFLDPVQNIHTLAPTHSY